MSNILTEAELLQLEQDPPDGWKQFSDLVYTLRFWREQAGIAQEERDQYKEKYEKVLNEGVAKELEEFKRVILLGIGRI